VPKAVIGSANSRFVTERGWQQVRRHLAPESGHKGRLAIDVSVPRPGISADPLDRGALPGCCGAPGQRTWNCGVTASGQDLYLLSMSKNVPAFHSLPARISALPEAGRVLSPCLDDRWPA